MNFREIFVIVVFITQSSEALKAKPGSCSKFKVQSSNKCFNLSSLLFCSHVFQIQLNRQVQRLQLQLEQLKCLERVKLIRPW